MIGIKKIPLEVIKNKRGDIFKFISKNNKYYKNFGEIYFSEIKYKKKKGWNYHKKNKCHVAPIAGKIKFDFFKKKKGKFIRKKAIISKNDYSMIIIPPKIYFAFQGLSKFNLLVNFLERPHDPKESLKYEKINGIKIK